VGQYLEVVMTWAPRGDSPAAPKRSTADKKKNWKEDRVTRPPISFSLKGDNLKIIFKKSVFICFTNSFSLKIKYSA